jgi:two-component system chemotaxis response regulator CheB
LNFFIFFEYNKKWIAMRDIIVIGGSLGAIDALPQICRDLPADLPAAIFVARHVGAEGHDSFAAALTNAGPLPAVIADDDVPFATGKIYLAPADRHLLVMNDVLRLGRGPRENMCRPAVDPLFRSAACSHGPRVIGLVLTGLLNDGAAGLSAIKRCGGITAVQNPSDALANSMPLNALEASDVDYRAPAAELGRLLAKLAAEPAGTALACPSDLDLEVRIAFGRPSDSDVLQMIADPVALSCPECGGVLSEMKVKSPLRFRCQIGHAYTAKALDHEMEKRTHEALAVSLRIVGERVTLMQKMINDARRQGRNKSADMFDLRRREYQEQADLIRDVLLSKDEL